MRPVWRSRWPIYLTNWPKPMNTALQTDSPAASLANPKPKSPPRSGRTRAREFAIQALYQHLVGKNDVGDIDIFTRDLQGFSKADAAHYDALFHGCVTDALALDAHIIPLLDRPLAEISPVERAVMWLGVYELQHCLDVPWRVVLNEYIEQAKAFGGTDGHKYVNGVLNKLAPVLRSAEVAGDKAPSNQHAKTKAAKPD
jgi:transcription antitermination protein NusB